MSYVESKPPLALIVDDDRVSRAVLRNRLYTEGYAVEEVTSGEEALAVCRKITPDVIFLDIMMPDEDGFSICQRIRKLHDFTTVPVIFLSALEEQHHLKRCIEVGGNDFLSKPVQQSLLMAKLESARRLQRISTIIQQRDELASYRTSRERDLEVAKRILDKVSTPIPLRARNVNYLLQPMEQLNGDLILGAVKPTGEQCFLIGDFTGHGLPAAIGAMTVHGVFLSMIGKGFSLDEIAQEMNAKLFGLLPVERFFCAVLIELQNDTGQLRIWNGGMPDVLVTGREGMVLSRFGSINLPLGIVDDEHFESRTLTAELNAGEQLLCYSDGLIEAENLNEEPFGIERVLKVLDREDDPAERFEALIETQREFVSDAPQKDDVSVLSIWSDPEFSSRSSNQNNRTAQPGQAGIWNFSVVFDADRLRNSDPVTTAMQLVEAVQVLGRLRTPIFMVLTELCSNAIEHGLLDISSQIKQTPNGFAEYYDLRQKRLEALNNAELVIECHHLPTDDGGLLRICVAHSGTGFHESMLPEPEAQAQFKGRGIRLVKSLCESLEYIDDGRCAVGVYRWNRAAA